MAKSLHPTQAAVMSAKLALSEKINECALAMMGTMDLIAMHRDRISQLSAEIHLARDELRSANAQRLEIKHKHAPGVAEAEQTLAKARADRKTYRAGA